MAEISGPVILALITVFTLFVLEACTSRSDDTYKGVACVVDGRC